jgi:uncharacterized membrane protein
MHYWDYGWHTGWMPFWWLCGIAVLAVVIWLAAAATRRSGDGDSPERILKRRYAGGEITHEEYERKLAELRR